jgi:hypothetical protein
MQFARMQYTLYYTDIIQGTQRSNTNATSYKEHKGQTQMQGNAELLKQVLRGPCPQIGNLNNNTHI